ncbi:hypothetical protein G7Z17_g5454 [Cylindrodendrum hubeiense]|uniref:Uncharacterized protein n=1 Tax=Cylindrodendrum hubeiense TaxID=595255 RepID=A0A9P5HE47_9HYPO|nr:hypothetical protein G7Z17_g5454 [Cylindrodendrum hubeiense]
MAQQGALSVGRRAAALPTTTAKLTAWTDEASETIHHRTNIRTLPLVTDTDTDTDTDTITVTDTGTGTDADPENTSTPDSSRPSFHSSLKVSVTSQNKPPPTLVWLAYPCHVAAAALHDVSILSILPVRSCIVDEENPHHARGGAGLSPAHSPTSLDGTTTATGEVASLSPGVNGLRGWTWSWASGGAKAPTPATPRTRARHQEDAGSAANSNPTRKQRQAIHLSQARAMASVGAVGTPSLTWTPAPFLGPPAIVAPGTLGALRSCMDVTGPSRSFLEEVRDPTAAAASSGKQHPGGWDVDYSNASGQASIRVAVGRLTGWGSPQSWMSGTIGIKDAAPAITVGGFWVICRPQVMCGSGSGLPGLDVTCCCVWHQSHGIHPMVSIPWYPSHGIWPMAAKHAVVSRPAPPDFVPIEVQIPTPWSDDAHAGCAADDSVLDRVASTHEGGSGVEAGKLGIMADAKIGIVQLYN